MNAHAWGARIITRTAGMLGFFLTRAATPLRLTAVTEEIAYHPLRQAVGPIVDENHVHSPQVDWQLDIPEGRLKASEWAIPFIADLE